MSSYPTAPTSTTASATSWPSPADPVRPQPQKPQRPQPHRQPQSAQAPQAVVIACGALGGPIRDIAARRGWPVELHCLPALLHNRPAAITPEVERLARAAQDRGLPVAI